MTATKHILVVDKTGGALAKLSVGVELLEYRVVSAPDTGAALLVVEKYSKLCLVVVNAEQIGERADRFASEVHRVQPDIPVLWIGACDAAKELKRSLEGRQLDLFLDRVPSQVEFQRLVEESLNGQFYTEDVLHHLIDASREALDSFHVCGSMDEPFLKANRTSLAEINAILSFSGTSTAGHVLVGGSRRVARRAAEKLFAKRTRQLAERDVADVLGELTNMILGKLLWFFEARGTPARFGLPIYLEGGTGRLWNERRSPSLGLEFEGPDGLLFVELSFTQLGEAQSSELSPNSMAPNSKGCVFL